jgi:hypothetical protein
MYPLLSAAYTTENEPARQYAQTYVQNLLLESGFSHMPIPMTNCTAMAAPNSLFVLRDVDMRTHVGRRYRDIVHSLVDEAGGEARLDEATRLLIKQSASLSVRIEAMQADIVAGKPVDDEQFTRMSNTLARTLERLRSFRKADKDQSLAAYLKGAA